jgi:hypothetical protein
MLLPDQAPFLALQYHPVNTRFQAADSHAVPRQAFLNLQPALDIHDGNIERPRP